MADYQLSEYTARRLIAMLNAVAPGQDLVARPDKALNRLAPFVITEGPIDNGIYRGLRLFYIEDSEAGEGTGSYETDEEGETYDIYNPTETELSGGDRIFCAFRGRWEAVASPGVATSKMYAFVMEAVQLTERPQDGPDEYEFGKIQIVGKEYPTEDENGDPIEPEYDDCACFTLGKDPNGDDHEQLYKGLGIWVRGPYERKNPDYVPPEENEEPEEPEYLEFYLAEHEGYYYARLDSDIKSGEFGTITLQDDDGDDVVMAVSGSTVRSNHYLKGGAESYIIESHMTNYPDTTRTLIVVGGPCAIEEEQEEEQEEEPIE